MQDGSIEEAVPRCFKPCSLGDIELWQKGWVLLLHALDMERENDPLLLKHGRCGLAEEMNTLVLVFSCDLPFQICLSLGKTSL